MKILMVNKFLYPRGGCETYMLNLAEELKAKPVWVSTLEKVNGAYRENGNLYYNGEFAPEITGEVSCRLMYANDGQYDTGWVEF